MPEPRPLRPGDPERIGPHLLVGFLGEGGQGVVYLARTPSGERVALKVLHARLSDDAHAKRRFQREADAARRVAPFCTARVLQADATGDRPYILSEYVDGESLQQVVSREGPREEYALFRLAVATATALSAIHRAGIVHRDLKPSNVLLGPDGPRVIDFGIAKALDSAYSLTTDLVGTPAYMAPEQFHEQEVGPAGDVFAWAGTMVFAATGRPPFGLGNLAVVMRRILVAEPDLSGVPESLRPLLDAALTKDPRSRPGSADVLDMLLNASGGPAPASGTFPPPAPGSSAPEPSAGGPAPATAPPPRRAPGSSAAFPAPAPLPGRAPVPARSPAPPSAPSSSSAPSRKPPYAPSRESPSVSPRESSPSSSRKPSPAPSRESSPATPSTGFSSPSPGRFARFTHLARLAGTAGRPRILAVLVTLGAACVLGVATWLVLPSGEPAAVPRVTPKPAPTGFDAASASVVNPSARKGGTMRFGAGFVADSFDPGNTYYPSLWNVARLYGRSLTMYRPVPGAGGRELVGDLAEGLGVPSDGGRTWTYRLREGLKYENGTPIVAADVKHAVLRAIGKDTLSRGPYHFEQLLNLPSGYRGYFASPKADTDGAIRTPDDRTVVFHLRKPHGAFDHVAQVPQTMPVPEAKDTGAAYEKRVLSSGPYRFESAEPGKRLVLVRNPHWSAAADPNRRALPDRYEITFAMKQDAVDKGLVSGDLDLDLDSGASANLPERIAADPALRARADAPTIGWLRYVAINPQVLPFDNVACRRAVFAAADREALRDAYGRGLRAGTIATGLLPPTISGHRPLNLYQTGKGDVAGARGQLAACGRPGGFAATIVFRAAQPAERKAAEALRTALGRVGIRLTLRGMSQADHTAQHGGSPSFLRKEKIGLSIRAWTADWPEGGSYLPYLADSREILEDGLSFNVSVRLPEADYLIDQAGAELDPGRREELWARVDRTVMEQAVVLPVQWDTRVLLRGKRLTNVHVSHAFSDYDYVGLGLS
ncbi:ABC transporter substrate-binding protein [Streptosporangium sp. NPDC002524]|uniref:ABC transporter substrate-binding protein n=1 Tax=Streptosporangium sp. NPDC002524 TaxID=3154537 RepID=UPI00331C3749